ncbi:hypothetical protein EJ06DRAFT_221976 [Trichodelitschia bisporula]|uniref:Uncharacterized protein n=1 Tax=Trichodelitschia bisporula TaxID=703511 RepID=A0A6G1HKG6_9PEZI|nr:hypothetical protein EJ06DRAFT_221976 [Trichodelitschia bisporula]
MGRGGEEERKTCGGDALRGKRQESEEMNHAERAGCLSRCGVKCVYLACSRQLRPTSVMGKGPGRRRSYLYVDSALNRDPWWLAQIGTVCFCFSLSCPRPPVPSLSSLFLLPSLSALLGRQKRNFLGSNGLCRRYQPRERELAPQL